MDSLSEQPLICFALPPNREQRLSEETLCPLSSDTAAVKHILSGLKASLSQGRYTWQHNQVLKCPVVENES